MNADPERWRSRPGTIGELERERALSAIVDFDQTGLRQFDGGLP